ncbi:MAG: hypothetical protein JWQ07_295 [Ramlibacter sp.]|nr:hypothetical protein [Ramlibacter sp.]
MFKPVLPVIVACLSSLASAQLPSPIAGKWAAVYPDSHGRDRDAEVLITGGAGTWHDIARNKQAKHNPCLGRSFPLAATTEPSGEVKIRVDVAGTVPGCGNHSMTLKAAGADVLEGKLKDGRPVKLTRK